jgi:hypothetical protein
LASQGFNSTASTSFRTEAASFGMLVTLPDLLLFLVS